MRAAPVVLVAIVMVLIHGRVILVGEGKQRARESVGATNATRVTAFLNKKFWLVTTLRGLRFQTGPLRLGPNFAVWWRSKIFENLAMD